MYFLQPITAPLVYIEFYPLCVVTKIIFGGFVVSLCGSYHEPITQLYSIRTRHTHRGTSEDVGRASLIFRIVCLCALNKKDWGGGSSNSDINSLVARLTCYSSWHCS